MDGIFDFTNGKKFGTFKFQYSKYHPVEKEHNYLLKDKTFKELVIAHWFSQTLRRNYNANFEKLKLNKDDSNKQADVLFSEGGKEKGIQLTQLQFTNLEERKQVAKVKNLEFAKSIAHFVQMKEPIIINIHPNYKKDEIPLKNIKKGKAKIEAKLINFIGTYLNNNKPSIENSDSPIWIVLEKDLNQYYKTICINRIPRDGHPNFPGTENIFINYDFNDASYNEKDVETAALEIFHKKNFGSSNILLIWSDWFELVQQERMVFEKIYGQFRDTSFEEVYFMTFINIKEEFEKSINVWPIKTHRAVLS